MDLFDMDDVVGGPPDECSTPLKEWRLKLQAGTLTRNDFIEFFKKESPKYFDYQNELDTVKCMFKEALAKEEIIDVLVEFMLGDNPKSALEKLRLEGNTATVCGKVFKNGEPTYSCRECGMDPTCVLCVNCFKRSAHRFHKYKMSTSGGGGCCDCGDNEAWKKDHYCHLHLVSGTEADLAALQHGLSDDLALERILAIILQQRRGRMIIMYWGSPFSSEEYTREGLTDLISSVPQGSADGAELQGWNDERFVERFLPAQKLTLPTLISLKGCCFNIIHMLCGHHAYYEGAVSDMKTIILSMSHPNKKDEFLFEYILSGSTFPVGTEKETYVETELQPVTTNYFAEDTAPIEISGSTASILAGEVATTTRSGDMGAIMPDQITTRENIGEFWNTLYAMTSKMTSQGSTDSSNEKTLISVLGFVCLHTLKLITREVRSVQNSMSLRMSAQYAAIYKNTSFTRKIVAPCASALRDLKTAYLNKSISLDLLGILIGRNMIERAEPIPDDNIFGILHGTCLLHVSMYGLAPIKYFEQAAKALGMKNSEFASLICTSLVKKSIIDISQMLIYANKPHTVKIYGKNYNLASQSTWRYARLYNANYFNRFITTKNARIVIRCAAYIAVRESSSQIDQMNILQGHTNKAIFLKEKERAEEHARNQISQNDAPLTKDAETIYKQKETITSSAFNMKD